MSLSTLEMIVIGALLLVLLLVVDILVCRSRHDNDSRRHERGSRQNDVASVARQPSRIGVSPISSRRWLRRRKTGATVRSGEKG